MKKTSLGSKTKAELLKLAQRLGLRGVSTLKKDELISRIERARQKTAAPKAPVAAPSAAQRAAAALKRRAIRKRESAVIKKTPPPTPTPKPAKKLAPVAKPAAPVRTPKTVKVKPVAVTPPVVVATPVVVAKPAPAPVPVVEEFSSHKFDVTPVAAAAPRQVFQDEQLGELPDSYGTGRLFLTARDPHWLYAYWDLTLQQMADYRKRSADDRLLLRVFVQDQLKPVQELTLTHDARNWYIPVNKSATTFYAELGFLRRDETFNLISRSGPATTPAEVVSADTAARFVTIPVEVPFEELVTIVRGHTDGGPQLAEALLELQASGAPLPFQVGVELGPWSEEQTKQLERLVGGDVLRRTQTGSFEISDWLRKRLQEELSSGLSSGFSPAGGFSPGGTSWQQAAGKPQPGFWFAVNAELIIYGATEPDATVTIDGKPITLRKDGTFAFHYIFPDGQYRLPVVAVSARGDDQRAVQLQFERKTATQGDVGKVRQPAQLQSPKSAP